MQCWYNTLTAAVSRDGGSHFTRSLPDSIVASLPYQYTELPPGHHGYFNPSNIVTYGGMHYVFTFATKALAQQEGNCLLRTQDLEAPSTWRAWSGADFSVAFSNPYGANAASTPPTDHLCTPVAAHSLCWPVTSLVRHAATGLFIALMQDTSINGGVFYSTSNDLIHWSGPAMLMPAVGLGVWTCKEPPPLAYPSMLDPDSPDRNFETLGDTAQLFATRFNVTACRTGLDRSLIRWSVRIGPATRFRELP